MGSNSLIPRIIRKLGSANYGLPQELQLESGDRARINRVINDRLTYLAPNRMARIVNTLKQIEKNGVAGDVMEAGCALGGSAIVMAQTKSSGRALKIYDVFGMIPAPSENDGEDVHQRYEVIKSGGSKGIDGDQYYGYEDDLITKVKDGFTRLGVDIETENVHLIKGLVQDTMKVEGPVALAHIDVDWYDPVMVCLERIVPHLSPGGAIIIDDYSDWSGCREATDAYFADKKDQFVFDTTSGSLKITHR